MPRPDAYIPSQTGNRRARLAHAFTFLEILFAVMIMGIGFIMLAAMFPVAIRQTQTTLGETVGAGIGRAGAAYLEQIANSTTMSQADGTVHPLSLPASVAGNQILPSDNRYAWVPLYKRGGSDSFAQVFIIGVQARNHVAFTNAELPYNLQPVSVSASIQHFTNGAPDLVTLSGNTISRAAPDTYLLIGTSPDDTTLIGQVYRLGNAGANPGQWELQPGNDTGWTTNRTVNNITAYIVGRGLTDPTKAYDETNNRGEGLSQDVAAYTTFVPVK